MTYPKTIHSNPPFPSAYDHHAHSSEKARILAKQGLILLTSVGSSTHGTSVSGQDDLDLMGICLEPKEYVTGLATVPRGAEGNGQIPFEQFERHTAWDRAGGVSNRSGSGDIDIIVYGARKWARLALNGNPTVLLPLFVNDADTLFRSEHACQLIVNSGRFISVKMAHAFLGYLKAQREAMTGKGHTNRPELVAVHGYDTKFAMHALRLGLQGVEILSTGTISLPVQEPNLTLLRSIRAGELSLDDVLYLIDREEKKLEVLAESETLPRFPDYEWVDKWLHNSYMWYWQVREYARKAGLIL